MQHVRFQSITEFFDFLPQAEREICHVLRGLVLENLPDVKEKLSFQVPFYSLQRNICFLWPGSVLWGNKRMYDGVRMGFNYGFVLQEKYPALKLEHRKQVAYLDIVSLEQILELEDTIRTVLLESREYDKQKMKRS